jgi:hypothetical protein
MSSSSTAPEPAFSFVAFSSAPLDLWYARMERAESTEGWPFWRQRHNIHVAVADELIAALATRFSKLPEPILELAAGYGALAAKLRRSGIRITATDSDPADGAVARLSPADALRTLAPQTVFCCFAPLDSGIERQVLECGAARHFLYIGPLVARRPGPEALWSNPAWNAEPLPDIDRVLLTRLDSLADSTRSSHQRRAGALLLHRL